MAPILPESTNINIDPKPHSESPKFGKIFKYTIYSKKDCGKIAYLEFMCLSSVLELYARSDWNRFNQVWVFHNLCVWS